MDLGVVVVCVEVFPSSVFGTKTPERQVGARHRRAPPAGRIDRLGEKERAGVAEAGAAHRGVHLGQDAHVIQRGFTLLNQDAARAQGAAAVGIEVAGEETDRGPDGVRTVDDDDVQTARIRLLDPAHPVFEQKVRARIPVGGRELRKKHLRETRHPLVDVDLNRLLHTGVLQHLA